MHPRATKQIVGELICHWQYWFTGLDLVSSPQRKQIKRKERGRARSGSDEGRDRKGFVE